MLKRISALICVFSLSLLPISAKAFNLGNIADALNTTVDVIDKVTDNNSSNNSSSNNSSSDSSSNNSSVSTNSSSNSQGEKRLKGGMTILIEAASRGDSTKMKEALATNPDINAQDDQGKTALHYTARGNDWGMKDLLKHKPNLNIVDNEGYTAIMRAANSGYVRCVAPLIEAGADTSILPPGKTLEDVVYRDIDYNTIISMMKSAGGVLDMPKHYTIDANIMKHAKNVAKGFMGDSFVDVLFLESSLRPFKSTKWPHPITHYSMEVGLIAKGADGYTMRKTDMQVFNGGASQSDVRFQSSMNRVSLTQKIDYK